MPSPIVDAELSFNSFENESCLSIDLLSDYITRNFIPVKKIRHIRNGSHYTLEVNQEYIVRISRIEEIGYVGEYKAKSEFIQRRNSKYLSEIKVSNSIFSFLLKSYQKMKLEYSLSTNYLYSGMYDCNVIGIYKKVDGDILDPRRGDEYRKLMERKGFCPEKFGFDFSRFLTELHSIDAFDCGFLDENMFDSIRAKKQNKQPKTIYNMNRCIEYIKTKDSGDWIGLLRARNLNDLISVCEKSVHFFNKNCNLNKLVMIHAAIECSHLLTDGKIFSGVIDWEHVDSSQVGWVDVSDFFLNFILTSDSYEISSIIWKSFISNYKCSSRNGLLNEEEIHHIITLALIKYYVRFTNDYMKDGVSKKGKSRRVLKISNILEIYNQYGL